jgi:threonine synthase
MNSQLPHHPSPEPPFITELRCLRCGATYAPDEIDYVCPHHANEGSDLGSLDVQYDYDAIAAVTSPARIAADPDRSIGRYWALLPIADRHSLSPLAVGNTPLTHASRLGTSIGLPNLYVKDDGRNPSASLKDRASAIAVARAHDLQVLLSCMVETSLGITAAAHLAPLADWADLDGNLWLVDDPFLGVHVQEGMSSP